MRCRAGFSPCILRAVPTNAAAIAVWCVRSRLGVLRGPQGRLHREGSMRALGSREVH